MLNYRSVNITIREAEGFQQHTDNHDYEVTAAVGLVFAAHCKFGTSYAKIAPDALEGCKLLIDRALQS